MTTVVEAGEQELREITAQKGTVIVEFWAPWCPQCPAMRGVVDRLAAGLVEGSRALAVNVEAHPGAAEQHDVKSLPVLLLFRDGRLQARLDGFKRLPAIMERFGPYLERDT